MTAALPDNFLILVGFLSTWRLLYRYIPLIDSCHFVVFDRLQTILVFFFNEDYIAAQVVRIICFNHTKCKMLKLKYLICIYRIIGVDNKERYAVAYDLCV